MPARFDLEAALAAWRRRYEVDRAFSPEDVEELERHVRDHLAALVARGWDEEDAFREAVRGLGDYEASARAYREVYWAKAAAKGTLIDELMLRLAMLKNYVVIALRNLRRQAGYAAINLVGLSVGLACFLLVALYLQYAYRFDAYHAAAERTYRLVSYAGLGEKQWDGYIAGDPIAVMRETFAGVEDATKIHRCGSDRIVLDGEVYGDVSMTCAESNLFTVFSFDLVRGDAETVLDRPNTAVVTRSLARRLFGDEDPVGKTIPQNLSGTDLTFEITGLMEDVPAATHFTFDLALSYVSLEATNLCLSCGQPMYARLAPGADPEDVAGRILTEIRDVQGREYVEDIRLEALPDIYFSDIGAPRQGDVRYVYLLSAIAIVILLLACANYTNLAAALSMRRTREVGVRKVVGARRGQLVRQFLAETMLLALLALPLAFLLLALALPTFNRLADTEVALALMAQGPFLVVVLGTLLAVGLVAGSYPALFLSRFQAIEVLGGRLPAAGRRVTLRRVLVVMQFAVTLVLLIGTAVILRQLHFMQTKALGFDKEQVVVVSITDPVLAPQYEVLKQEFGRVPGVLSATAGSGVPGQQRFAGAGFIARPQGKDGPAVRLVTPVIDADFLETIKVPLLAGRNISEVVLEGPYQEALVNEATVRVMEWGTPEEALGREPGMGRVVGVVPDFHFQSLHQGVEPMLMTQNRWGGASQIALRLAPGDVPGTLAALESTWKATGTVMPFEYRFLSDEIDDLYGRERRTAQVFGLFAGLAVLIAVLGLFGLAAFTAAQRRKEIGIRKVMGASVPRVVTLLTRDVLALVVVAFLLAVPAAYFASERWLSDFPYRIEVPWSLFVLAGAAVVAVAFLAVGYQALRAALASPVEALRYE